jgi:sorting nexin-25
MARKSRDVAVAATFAFIAWGFATGWVPTLRYLGYAFTTGFCLALLSIAALILLSSRRIHEHDGRRERPPRTVAFIDPVTWKSDTAWLARRDSYNPVSLYPSSYIISNALDNLLEWLLRDLVISWYSNITRNPNFIHEVDRAIRAAVINVRDKLLPLDVVEIAVSRFVPIVTEHLKEFYQAERAIRGRNLNRSVTESEELDLAIAGKYRDGNLHPAASLAYSDPKIVQQEHLRKIVAQLLPLILPENLIGSRAVSVLLKEILACAVMAPLMQLLSDPDVWNQLMEGYVWNMDRKSSQFIC